MPTEFVPFVPDIKVKLLGIVILTCVMFASDEMSVLLMVILYWLLTFGVFENEEGVIIWAA